MSYDSIGEFSLRDMQDDPRRINVVRRWDKEYGSEVSGSVASSQDNSEGEEEDEQNPDSGIDGINETGDRDSRGLRSWRMMVIVLLVCSASIVSGAAFLVLKLKEEDQYDENYVKVSDSIQATFEYQSQSFQRVLQSSVRLLESDSVVTGHKFPFFTMPNFESVGQTIRGQIAAVRQVMLVPIVVFMEDGVTGETSVDLWNEYSVQQQGWLQLSRQLAQQRGVVSVPASSSSSSLEITPFLWQYEDLETNRTQIPVPLPTDQVAEDDDDGVAMTATAELSYYTPVWQVSPPPVDPSTSVNRNLRVLEWLMDTRDILQNKSVAAGAPAGYFTPVLALDSTLQEVVNASSTTDTTTSADVQGGGTVVVRDDDKDVSMLAPHSLYIEPIFPGNKNNGDADDEGTGDLSEVVAYLAAYVSWESFISQLVSPGVQTSVTVVLENTCGDIFSYNVNGLETTFLGRGDLHEELYDETELVIPFGAPAQISDVDAVCDYTLHVYSTREFEDFYRSSGPRIAAAVAACAFFSVMFAFLMYDWYVGNRNRKVVLAAARANDLLTSLFPRAVRDRFLDDRSKHTGQTKTAEALLAAAAKGEDKDRLKQFLADGKIDVGDEEEDDEDNFMYKSKPIADLYPETTIMFADIAGFTAWSSTREPEHVFTLLETLYRAFDDIARKMKVFKVETIGDCYVAVAGLPEPKRDHATTMCRFASECLYKMRGLTQKLQAHLGPDTTDLDMRFGLHSGAVTAGVLRGDRSRFQLFGDTMNTASRMESNGLRGKIQISQETADLIMAAGKVHWVTPREDRVVAKGKGELITYWVEIPNYNDSNQSTHEIDDSSKRDGDSKSSRGQVIKTKPTSQIFDWSVQLISRLIKDIMSARRNTLIPSLDLIEVNLDDMLSVDLVEEPISFRSTRPHGVHYPDVELEDDVVREVTMYMQEIADRHKAWPFHNFKRSLHVTMSLVKLIGDLVHDDGEEGAPANLLLADPLAHLACVLASLIHTVDHPGVPDYVLVKEGQELARKYNNRFVARQHSFSISWRILTSGRFENMRNAIFASKDEEQYFAAVLFRCVLATDLSDDLVVASRKSRWESLHKKSPKETAKETLWNQRATLILEYAMQTSAIAHALQHWDIYRKWNGRLFEEAYAAYMDGRVDIDPSEEWFETEVKFFDRTVNPTLKLLIDSGAFGTGTLSNSLSYCTQNRREWMEFGRDIMETIINESHNSRGELTYEESERIEDEDEKY